MQISSEGNISAVLGLIGLGGAGIVTVLPNHPEVGWALVALSAIGFVALGCNQAYERARGRTPVAGRPSLLGLVFPAMVFTWGLIGYDYYDRHHQRDELAGVAQSWGAAPPQSHYMELNSAKLVKLKRTIESHL
jgi:hypothetical protein